MLKSNSKILSQKEKDLNLKINRRIVEEHSKPKYLATQSYQMPHQMSNRNKALDLKRSSSQSKGKLFALKLQTTQTQSTIKISRNKIEVVASVQNYFY